MSAVEHPTWCADEHGDDGDTCVTHPVNIGPEGLGQGLSVWLERQDDQSLKVVIDVGQADARITPAQAQATAGALLLLAATAQGDAS